MDFRNLKVKDQFTFYEIAGIYVKLNDTQAMSDKGKMIHVNPNEEIKPYGKRNNNNQRDRRYRN